MTWDDFHQRQRTIRAILEHAAQHPTAQLELTAVPGADEVFADRADLLRALHYKWTQVLTGRIDVGVQDADANPHGDRVEAVTSAWRRAAADNPALREILDAHAGDPALAQATLHEQRMLALSAGLAESHEPASETNRVGKAFRSLLRAEPTAAPGKSRRPLSQLRKLIPSF